MNPTKLEFLTARADDLLNRRANGNEQDGDSVRTLMALADVCSALKELAAEVAAMQAKRRWWWSFTR